MLKPWRCSTCGGEKFRRVKNGTNGGRQTFRRECDVCKIPRGPSNLDRETCVRDGTSAWVFDDNGRRHCRECRRRRSRAAYYRNLEKHRARARRYQRERGPFRDWDDDEDPFLENFVKLQEALGR